MQIAAEITHYALELQMSAPSGSPYEWRELWCGAGHELVDFRALVNEEMARTSGDERALRDAQQHTKARRLKLTEALARKFIVLNNQMPMHVLTCGSGAALL